MSETLGIVFLHHHIDPVVLNNLQSVQRHNPGATIVTVSADQALPGGYTLQATPELKSLHSTLPTRSGDRLLCSWFLQRKEKCDKWWVIDWDVFCNTSVRQYYAPVWHYPFVAASVRLANREPEWFWFQSFTKKQRFKRREKMPADYAPYMMGAVPFLYLLSEAALKATCTMLLEHPLRVANSELRFTTAANRCGFAPCGFSVPNDQIGWIPLKTVSKEPIIFHPVKFLVDL